MMFIDCINHCDLVCNLWSFGQIILYFYPNIFREFDQICLFVIERGNTSKNLSKTSPPYKLSKHIFIIKKRRS